MKKSAAKNGYILVIMLVLLISGGLCPAGYAEEQPAAEPDSSGSMIIIPLENSAINAAKEFVQQLQASNVVHISAMVYAPPGVDAKLVLSGSQPDLQQALELYQKLLPKETGRHLVVIVASLRELTNSSTYNVGLRPVPTVDGTSITNWGRENDGSRIKNNTQTVTSTWTDIADLNEVLSKSKVLVSSEVYTPNGVKAQIADVKSVPTFSTDSNGNIQTQYQNLETSIGVVPTILRYNPDKPEESLVRVDVEVKVSIISGNLVFKTFTAPQYSVKNMTTTRILAADNRSNVIGTFVADSDVKTTTGIPILGKLPLLKYLFSHELKEKERNTAVLTLSVRLLPVPASQD